MSLCPLQDPVVAVEQIAKFLGRDLSKELMVDIAEKCSFKNLSSATDNVKQNATLPTLDNPGQIGTTQIYRKGNKQGFMLLLTQCLYIFLNLYLLREDSAP